MVELRVDHGQVDVLPAPGTLGHHHGREDAHYAVHRGRGVRHGEGKVDRTVARELREAIDQAGLGVHNGGVGGTITFRANLPEPGD